MSHYKRGIRAWSLDGNYVIVATLLKLQDHELRWDWDHEKNRINKRKHGLSFETAQLVFEDPLLLLLPDSGTTEERWLAIGAIGELVVIVAHTWPVLEHESNEEVGRIFSARKATAKERRAYEQGEF